MYIRSILVVIIFMFHFQPSSQRIAPQCERIYTSFNHETVVKPKQRISEKLKVSCKHQGGMVAVSYTRTYTYTITGSLSLKGLKPELTATFGASWAESVSSATTYTCRGSPGYKVFLNIEPEYGRIWGTASTKCPGPVGSARSREFNFDVSVPLKTGHGEMRGERECAEEFYETCKA